VESKRSYAASRQGESAQQVSAVRHNCIQPTYTGEIITIAGNSHGFHST
jgi:hypothetical protein